MERFVQWIVAGGLALVAGLWLLEGSGLSTIVRLAAGCLVLAGLAGMGAGIWTKVDV